MNSYDVICADSGYNVLLLTLWPLSSEFSLTVQAQLGLSEPARRVLKELSPWLRAKETTDTWPGTCLHGAVAEVYSFEAADSCLKVLSESAESLYDWVQPELPEDLALYRTDGSVLLESTAHEEAATVHLLDSEAAVGWPQLGRLLRSAITL